MSAASSKKILILAGPNGAGKTTFAREFLARDAECPTFVNADLIAEELSPGRPERAAMRAGRLMLKAIRDAVALPSADVAIARVAGRVAQGGHFVADEVVRRRFALGRANFETVYKPLVDQWTLLDSAGAEPILLDWAENR